MSSTDNWYKQYKKQKRKEIVDILKWGGIIVLGGAVLGGGAILAFDVQKNHFKDMSSGIPLLVDGIHLSQGDHNCVITESFHKYLTFNQTEETQNLVMNALKEAYTTLNTYNSKLNFNLCTTVDSLAQKYNIPLVNKIGKQDIALKMIDGVLDNNKNVMAHTNWDYNSFNYQMKDLSITYTTKYAFAVWTTKDTVEETLTAKNAVIYTTTVHESMHAMGIRHVDDYDSIMNTYVRTKSPKDLTEYDIEILDKYNVQFYGAESTLKTSSENLTSSVSTYAKTEELGM